MVNIDNYYDVTKWKGNPYEDVGSVINDIINDIKKRQVNIDLNDGGKPGAVIYLPPGDYRLKTQIKIDISFLKIMGSGHGFTSSSIRFNIPKEEWGGLHEIWPGGSRILNDIDATGDSIEENAAFLIEREGSPRISSVEFSNFCIDGLHFIDDGTGEENPENTYVNRKTGILAKSAQDSFKIIGMGFVYLEHAITMYHSDALTIHDNFIAECGNCIELRGWGQASKITDNLIGAGFKGYSIFAENFGGLLITSNNIFPRGMSSVHFEGVTRSLINNNRLHSFYPGMIVLDKKCSENIVSSNHFLHDHEPWVPLMGKNNGKSDSYGLLSIHGNNNSVIGNHFSKVLDSNNSKEDDELTTIIRVVYGRGNFISNNHTVATKVQVTGSDSCYSAQVDALLAAENTRIFNITTVKVEQESQENIVLDSGSKKQVKMNFEINGFRGTPTISNLENK